MIVDGPAIEKPRASFTAAVIDWEPHTVDLGVSNGRWVGLRLVTQTCNSHSPVGQIGLFLEDIF